MRKPKMSMGRIEMDARKWFSEITHAVTEAIYPAVCEVCGRPLVDGEEMMCLHCRIAIPRTNCHTDTFNTLHQRLASPGIPVERAGSFFYYIRDNDYARLIQRAKYNYRPGLGRRLGGWYAEEIKADGFFDGIEMILPVPLHWWKRVKRGYNQSEEIARGVSATTGILIGDNLSAASHSTQTRKSAFERLANVSDVMSVAHADELAGKHVLVIDDVITTGATLLACLMALHKSVTGITTSVLTLGATKMNTY